MRPASSDFRIVLGLIGAGRTTSPWGKPRGSNPAARLGLRYERQIKRELEHHATAGNLYHVDHNPWLTFTDTCGTSLCCPDFVIDSPLGATVVEVKLTWVPVAAEKLRSLYCPVVSCILGDRVRSLIIVKYMAFEAPKASYSLIDALRQPEGLLHWPGNGHIPW